MREKILFFKDDKTIQGYTVARATGEIIPNVKIDINNGIRSKKLTIFPTKKAIINLHLIMIQCYY